MRILLIEDDSATAQGIELMLKSEGMNVYTTDWGEEGIDLAKHYDYDLVLLDLGLPDMSGYEVLNTLRKGKVDTPVMILSGLSGIENKVRGLGFGADDYMTKPFHKAELVARIQAIVRRDKGHADSILTFGDLTINLDSQQVSYADKKVHLTGKEYQMMQLLALRSGTTLTKDMFLNQLYGGMDEPELKIIDVFICKLRRKLRQAVVRSKGLPIRDLSNERMKDLAKQGVITEAESHGYIETVWGRGYTLVPDSETGRTHTFGRNAANSDTDEGPIDIEIQRPGASSRAGNFDATALGLAGAAANDIEGPLSYKSDKLTIHIDDNCVKVVKEGVTLSLNRTYALAAYYLVAVTDDPTRVSSDHMTRFMNQNRGDKKPLTERTVSQAAVVARSALGIQAKRGRRSLEPLTAKIAG